MTEKRYYTHKHLLQENKVHDKICHNFMNIDETVEHMNNQYWKYKQLKEENERLKIQLRNISYQRDEFHRGGRENANRVGKLEKENEQLKSEIIKVIDRKIKNNNSNPPKDCYYKVARALTDVKENLRDVIEDFEGDVE